jgi:hypothetical protein
MHTAKCTIDYLGANRLTRAAYPAFSPDLELSDFYMFGKQKIALMGAAFANHELLQGVMEMFNGISRQVLETIFEEWLLTLDKCIHQNREYVE